LPERLLIARTEAATVFLNSWGWYRRIPESGMTVYIGWIAAVDVAARSL
jgi:hypothetical protein